MAIKAKKGTSSGTLEANTKAITFFKLSKTTRPCIIPWTIELKSSVTRVIYADSLATEVPLPMAIPTLAAFRAGASLTPSYI